MRVPTKTAQEQAGEVSEPYFVSWIESTNENNTGAGRRGAGPYFVSLIESTNSKGAGRRREWTLFRQSY